MSNNAMVAIKGDSDEEERDSQRKISDFRRWLVNDNMYRPIGNLNTIGDLIPGYYDICHDNQGLFFDRVEVKTESLMRFPDANTERVVQDIKTFWDREEKFRRYNLSYKRGILLYGPPGSGKSCTLRLVAEDVIHRQGVIFNFGESPDLFYEGYLSFRQIQPNTPIVVIMEDVDGILSSMSESKVLNILDGVKQIDKIVFLATTNYPSQLKSRITNRPSRFDKNIEIGYPSDSARQLYFESLFKGEDLQGYPVPIDKVVEDTDKLTFAHLRELFIATFILGDIYENTVENLHSMKEQIVEDAEFKEKRGEVGFHAKEKVKRNW